jgi:hypothetical protein
MKTLSKPWKGKRATTDLDISTYGGVSATRNALGIDVPDKAIVVAYRQLPGDDGYCYFLAPRNHAFSRREG